MNNIDTKSKEAAPTMGADVSIESAQKINDLAVARYQELGVMCQRRRNLQEEMGAVARRIDQLNSEIQGVSAAFHAIVEPASEMPQGLSRIR